MTPTHVPAYERREIVTIKEKKEVKMSLLSCLRIMEFLAQRDCAEIKFAKRRK